MNDIESTTYQNLWAVPQHPEENRWTNINLIKSKEDKIINAQSKIQLEKLDNRKIK